MKNALCFFIVVLFLISLVSSQMTKVSIDVSTNQKYVYPGEEVSAEISIFNKQLPEGDIVLKHSIIDEKGNTISEASETIFITTRLSHLKTLTVPTTAEPGKYYFLVEIVRGNEKVGEASDVFYVKKVSISKEQRIMLIAFSIETLLLLFAIYKINKLGKAVKINEEMLVKAKLIRLKGGK